MQTKKNDGWMEIILINLMGKADNAPVIETVCYCASVITVLPYSLNLEGGA